LKKKKWVLTQKYKNLFFFNAFEEKIF